MAKDGTARIKVQAVGRESVRAVLNGVRSDTRKLNEETRRAARAQEQAAKKAAREVEQAAKKSARAQEQELRKVARVAEQEAKKASRAQEREAKKAAAAIEREHKRANDKIAREAEKSARARARAEQRAQRDLARHHAGVREGRVDAIGGMGMGLATGALAATGLSVTAVLSGLGETLNRVTTALEQRAGVQSLEEGIVSGQEFERRSTEIGGLVFGEVGPEEFETRLEGMRNRIAEVARATNQDPGELLEALHTFHEQFSDFDFGMGALEGLARTARATGEPVTDLVLALGEAREQLQGISDTQADEFFGVLAEQAEAGKITPQQFARVFAPGMAQFKDTTGHGGMAGLREFGALVQTQAMGGGGPEQAATRMTEAMRLLTDTKTQQRLRRATHGRVQVRRDANGQLDIIGLLEQMSTDRGLDSEEELGAVFRDTQGRRGIATWLKNLRDHRGDGRGIRDIQNVDAAAGQAQLAAGFGRVMSTADMQQQSVVMDERLSNLQLGADRGRSQIDEMQQRTNIRQMLPVIGGTVAGDNSLTSLAMLTNSIRQNMRQKMAGLGPGFQVLAGWMDQADAGASQHMMGRAQQIERFAFGDMAQGQKTVQQIAQQSRTTIEDQSIDRLARRVGEEVASHMPNGPTTTPNGDRRGPGGPARR